MKLSEDHRLINQVSFKENSNAAQENRTKHGNERLLVCDMETDGDKQKIAANQLT